MSVVSRLSAPGAPAAAWGGARRVLAVRLDAIGDVVMTGPALRALKAVRPDRHLTLLTSSAGAGVASLLPEVDATIRYDPPWMKHSPQGRGPDVEQAMARTLREGRFDAAVIFTVVTQSPLPMAFLLHLAEVPLRLAHCRENPYEMLSDWVKDPEPDAGTRHEVQRHLDLVGVIGARTLDTRLRLDPGPEAQHAAGTLAAQIEGRGDRRWVVVHVGATAPSRRYPPEHFARVIRSLVRDLGVRVVMTGGAGDVPLVRDVVALAEVPVVDLAGALALPTMTALLARAPLLVSNNTGPVHLAAAVGTPVVDLYALTNPQHTPWGVPHRVLYHDVPCRFCLKSVCPEGHHLCLRGVEPARVVAAVEELLATAPGSDRGRGSPARRPVEGRPLELA